MSSGIAASPSSARRAKSASVHEDEDAESLPSPPSRPEGEDEDRAYTNLVLTINDVQDC